MSIELIQEYGRGDEISVDLFAGGGGASTGIEAAIGKPITIAINHCREAIEVHKVNHPQTRHFQEDVWQVSPRKAVGSRKVKWLWMSSSCTHFSRAKSDVPLDKNVRGLSWVGVRWAREVKPDVIMGENTDGITSWGPLLPNGRPDPSRKGDTWRAWVAAWHDLGYKFDWWTARASDFGVPTSRNRLYFCARRDGKPIVRPQPTHGKGLLPYVPASSIIDFSLPSKSIFDRKKPLVPATFKRLAAGLDRFVFKEDEPVVMERGGDLFLPWIAKHYGGPNGVQTPGLSVRDPLSTVTAVDHHALVQVDLVPEDAPTGDHEEEVIRFVCKYFSSGTNVVSIEDPLPTITTHDRFSLVSVHKKRKRITDIRMRMFSPEELKLAMGFPQSYALTHDSKGKPISRGKQIMLVGNAVCPPMAQRIVEAQMRAQ